MFALVVNSQNRALRLRVIDRSEKLNDVALEPNGVFLQVRGSASRPCLNK